MQTKRKKIIILILIQAIITSSYFPVLPYFIESANIDNNMFGVFLIAVSLGAMIGGPLWGNLYDQNKKKESLVIGMLLYSTCQFVFALNLNIYLMIFLRLISGIGVAVLTTVLISELICVTNSKNRQKYITYSAVCQTLGASIGYYIGGSFANLSFFTNIFKENSYQIIIIIQAILCFVLAGIIYLVFDPVAVNVENKKRTTIIDGFKEIKNIPKSLLWFLIAFMLINIAMINVTKYLDVYFKDVGYSSSELGKYQLIVGIVSVLFGIIIVPIVNKLKHRLIVITAIQLISSIIIYIVFRSDNFLLMAYSFMLVYMGIKTVFLSIEQNHISEFVESNNQGKVMGIRQSFLSLGNIIGPLLGTIFYSKSPLLLFDSSASIHIISIVFIVISGTITLSMKSSTNSNQ